MQIELKFTTVSMLQCMHKFFICVFILLLSGRIYAQSSSTDLILFQSATRQFGYKDASEQIVIKPQFEEATSFHENYALVKQNNFWGLINTKGKWVIPASYESLTWLGDKTLSQEYANVILKYQQQGKWGLISSKNKLITPANYDLLTPFTANTCKVGTISPDFKADTLLGIIDIQGKELVPCQYYSLATTTQEGILIAGKSRIYEQGPSNQMKSSVRAYGLINWYNKQLLPIEYKEIHLTDRGFEVIPFSTWKIIGEKGNNLSTHSIDSLYAISPSNFAFFSSGKTGIISTGTPLKLQADVIYPQQNGHILYKASNKYGVLYEKESALHQLLPALYDSLLIDNEEFIRAGILENTKWQWNIIRLADNQPTTITGQPYEQIEKLENNTFIRIQKNKMYGYINKSGKEIISAQYDSLGYFKDSVCVALYKGKYGILGKDGGWIFEPTSASFDINQSGYFIRKEKSKYELIDISGNVKYSSPTPLTFLAGGSVQTIQKGKVGRITSTGTLSVPPIYDSISPATVNHTFWAYLGKNVFLYSSTGEMHVKQAGVIEKIIYAEGQEFIPAKIGGRYGFVDGFGRLRIANRYEEAKPFKNGLAPVKLSGKWGFVNKQEKIAVQPYYEEVTYFSNGKAIVKKEGKYGIIDNQGKVSTPFYYDNIEEHATGNYISIINGKKGMLTRNGHKVIYEKYDEVHPQTNNCAIVQSGNKFGLLNEKGLTILPVSYDLIINNPFTNTYVTKETSIPFLVDLKDVSLNNAIKNK